MFYGQKLQARIWQGQIEGFLREVKSMTDSATGKLISTIVSEGKPPMDPSQRVRDFLDFFAIEPADKDPALSTSLMSGITGLTKRWLGWLLVPLRRCRQT